jgi:hypothetical protein
MDATDITQPVLVVPMLRAAGVWLRSLPGRPDRIWAPSWAVQVAVATGLKQDARVRFIEKVNSKLELREAAEAVALAGESVLEVLGKAVMP